MKTDHAELLSALIDREPVDPDALAAALDDPEGRRALVGFARVRAALQAPAPGEREWLASRHAPGRLRRGVTSGGWPRPRCSSRLASVPACSPSDTRRKTGRRSRPASSSSIPCPSIDREVPDVFHHSRRRGVAVRRAGLVVSHRRAAGAPASTTRVVPTLGIYAMPGFKYRAPGLGAGGVIPLDPEESAAPFNAVTIQSDASGHCTNSLQMPAADLGAFDQTASAAWRIEATPVTIDGDEATVDVRWSRRVPRSGVLLERSVEREERLTLRDGARGILDVVRAAGQTPGVCESFAIAVELRFGSPADEWTPGSASTSG